MEVKKTDKGYNFIEVDCQYKDVTDKFICSGKISLIRFFYKKNIPLTISSLKIGNTDVEWKRVHYSTLDYKYHLMGMVDLIYDIEFKEGDAFELKQFNEPNGELEDGTKINWDRFRNVVEKIQLFTN